ncbi:MAG: hypothetical protein LAP39_28445 [Acidobacteriia bacterium]|nr:hypothetical protein [Terriglobia bacterium]
MKDSSRPRHKKLEKISLEELMAAAGMSGFGALLEKPSGREMAGWQPPAESRLRFSLKGAALAEKMGRQNDLLRALKEPLTRRVKSLEQALEILSWITFAVSTYPPSSAPACAGAVPVLP